MQKRWVVVSIRQQFIDIEWNRTFLDLYFWEDYTFFCAYVGAHRTCFDWFFNLALFYIGILGYFYSRGGFCRQFLQARYAPMSKSDWGWKLTFIWRGQFCVGSFLLHDLIYLSHFACFYFLDFFYFGGDGLLDRGYFKSLFGFWVTICFKNSMSSLFYGSWNEHPHCCFNFICIGGPHAYWKR